MALLIAPGTAAGFGVETFTVDAEESNGAIDEVAASHPFTLAIHLAMDRAGAGTPGGSLKEVRVDLPPGMVGNPMAVPRCPIANFKQFVPLCPGTTQIGVLTGTVLGTAGEVSGPIYDLSAREGSAATFGVSIDGQAFVQQLTLAGTGATSSVRLDGVLPPRFDLVDAREEIWGVPAAGAHDFERICHSQGGETIEGCPSGIEERPLLTLPASCAAPLRTTLTATSSDSPPVTVATTALSRNPDGSARPLIGCEGPAFEPRLVVSTEAGPLRPTSLDIGLEMPRPEGTGRLGAARLAALRIALPQGVALNPASGAWLGGCPPSAVGLESDPGTHPLRFDRGPAGCPPASRLGTVKLQTPLIDHALTGSIYLATPGANPFATRFAIYLVIEDEATGTILKVAGRIDADPADGHLTAIIPELPQFPFSDLELEFEGGPRAPLASPSECGRYVAAATLTPSTAPLGVTVSQNAAFDITGGGAGRSCPSPEARRNGVPTFQAGTESSRAGAMSPLLIQLARTDADQRFGAFSLTLPPGLTANLRSIPLCPDGPSVSDAPASCPGDSAIGSVEVMAGLGPEPLRLLGTIYLAGPDGDAPYSLAIVVPAQVGPFDLGAVTQRAAVSIDPATAQLTIHSDPLPRILGGVPLWLRELRINLDRPDFIRNPTSCEPTTIGGSATTALGLIAPLETRFQVGDCKTLSFRPKLSLRLSGALGRNGHPAARAVLRGDPEGAAVSSADFTLPAGELLDLRHLPGLCPEDVAVARCPRKSLIGHLRLVTSLLDAPLEGSVYLRVPGHRLPGLSGEVTGGGLRFLINGQITRAGGRLGVSLGSIPDVPLSKAVLDLPGGRNGLIVNSGSLCRARKKVAATFTAHNGKRLQVRVRARVKGNC